MEADHNIGAPDNSSDVGVLPDTEVSERALSATGSDVAPSWSGTLSPSVPTGSPSEGPGSHEPPDAYTHQHSPPAVKLEPCQEDPPLLVKTEPIDKPVCVDGQASAKRRDISPPPATEKRAKTEKKIDNEEHPPHRVKKEEIKDEKQVKTDQGDEADMAVVQWTAAKRPDAGGRKGCRIPIFANVFLIDVMPKLQSLEQYEMEIEPIRILKPGQTKRPLPKLSASRKQELSQRNWEIYKAMIETFPNVFGNRPLAYDKQRILLSVDPLGIPDEGQIFEVREPALSDGRRDNFSVRVKPVGPVDIASIDSVINENLDARSVLPLQAIDIILRQSQYNNNTYFQCGNSFYRPQCDQDLNCGKFLHKGFHMSARPVQAWNPSRGGPSWQLALNVDVANSVFYAAVNLHDYICRFLNHNPSEHQFHPRELDAVHRHLKLLKVKTEKRVGFRKIFKPKGLHMDQGRPVDSTMVTFSWTQKDDAAQDINVADYFWQKYNIRLQYPDFPLVVAGTKDRTTYYPIEVLEVYPDQKVPNTQLKPEQLQQIIRSAAVPPATRKQETDQLIKNARIKQDPIANSFGLCISEQMAQFEARKIDPPFMKFAKQTEMPNRGAWNIRNNRFIECPKPLQKWSIINTAREVNERNLQDFFNSLRGAAEYNGLELAPEPCTVVTCMGIEGIEAGFEKILRKYEDTELIFSIVSTKQSLEYAEIKRCGDTVFGTMTQNLTAKSIKTMSGPKGIQALLNITHELTYKLNGVPAKIDGNDNKTAQKYFYNSEEPVLFIGAGISHPGPGSRSPSIAAIAGNIDLHPSRYVAQVRIQEKELEADKTKVRSRRAIIIELKDMMVNALRSYYKKSKTKPTKIVFYRNGVSEGQFLQVLQYEVTAVREACRALQKDYNPGITFVIVQRGQHTVFFPDGRGNPRENVPPGTVVDSKVVHPTEFDFHMVSSQGIQGTSRPIHYHVLHDDNGFSSDDIQEVTFYLAHLYGRCPRSVSVPAPVYYADLIATRARDHIKVAQTDGLDMMSSSSGGDRGYSADQIQALNKLIRINKDLKNRMYFI